MSDAARSRWRQCSVAAPGARGDGSVAAHVRRVGSRSDRYGRAERHLARTTLGAVGAGLAAAALLLVFGARPDDERSYEHRSGREWLELPPPGRAAQPGPGPRPPPRPPP